MDELIQKLKDRGMTIRDEEFAKKCLLSNTYYNVINGYSKYFPRMDEKFFAGLDSCHDLWLQYRAASEALKREKLLYETRTGVYRGDDRDTVLVMRVESIIASVNGDWIQIKQDEPPTPHSSTGS